VTTYSVFNGVTSSGITLKQGDSLYVSSGGTADSITVDSGGTAFV
jgi:autotransporter passenger strand-loop-strand repeat protein